MNLRNVKIMELKLVNNRYCPQLILRIRSKDYKIDKTSVKSTESCLRSLRFLI